MSQWRRGSWVGRRLVAGLLLAALAVLLYFTPTGYMIVLPGVTKPTADLVTAQGGRKPTGGRFLLVTVSTQVANPYIYVFGKVWPGADLEPLPPDPTTMEKEGQQQMSSSQALAAVVAEKALGLPAHVTGTGAKVVGIIKGGPADGVLQVGDVVTGVAGHEIQFQDQLRDVTGRLAIGKPVQVTVRRGGQTLNLTLTTVPHPSRPGRAAFLIDIDDDSMAYDTPVPVRIDAGDIIGPSAGLMFTLEVYNQLSGGEDLTRGRVVAGTGTILPDGRVGPIGGIEQKVVTAERSGATIFFAPLDDAEAARRVARKVSVVPVGHLQDAIDYLRALPPPPVAFSPPPQSFLDKRNLLSV